jgi:hypothetical protein
MLRRLNLLTSSDSLLKRAASETTAAIALKM